MISLKLKFSDEFINEYSLFCTSYIVERINIIKSKTSPAISDKMETLFSEQEIIKIISSEPEDLELILKNIYTEIPILAERYHQKLFFNSFSFFHNYEILNLRTKEGKDKILEIKNAVVLEIDSFISSCPSILLQEILADLSTLTKPSDIKKQFKKLRSIINGTCTTDEDFINKFPEWVEDISNAFNYDYVMRTYGKQIVDLIDLEYCPYCADEEIEPFDSYRPAIDHYFPQSKFPFLALSLYNFIPVGNRCNSNFKKAHTMENHFHPNMHEIPSQRLFEFLYPLDRNLSVDDVKISLKNICNKLDANSKLFRIDEVYNKNGIKRKFVYLQERINWLEGMDKNDVISDPIKIRKYLAVDLNLPPKKLQHKKFLIDSINLLWNCNLNID